MKISDVARINRWWLGYEEAKVHLKKYFNRIFVSFREIQDFKKNYIIRGPRQVGKTEFLFRSIHYLLGKTNPENIVYLPCDRFSGLRDLRNTVRELESLMRARSGMKFLLLDEITEIKGWEKAVKEFCEDKFFIVWATGSRPRALEKLGEYFPGRAEILNFYPLSFREFCIYFFRSIKRLEVEYEDYKYKESLLRSWDNHSNWQKGRSFLKRYLGIEPDTAIKILGILKKAENINPLNLESLINFIAEIYNYFEIFSLLFRIYIETGGYPIAIEKRIKNEELPYELVIKDTLGTIEKEGLNIEILNLLLPSLLEKLGSGIEYASLAREIEVDKSTVMRYINALENSFILREVHYFDGKTRVRREKKIYFSDPFIIKALQNYYATKEIDESLIVEGIVIETFARMLEKNDPFRLLWKRALGYSKIRGKEVDVVIKGEKSLKIEVKYGKCYEIKNVDILLTKDELSFGKPIKIPISLFLLSI